MSQLPDAFLLDILKRIRVVETQLFDAGLKYKIVGIMIHPRHAKNISDACIAHSIFGTDLSSLYGLKLIYDPTVDEPKIVLELPK